MIITAVDVARVAVPAYEPSFVWRAGLPGSEPEADGAWLVIRTDAGVSGLKAGIEHRRGDHRDSPGGGRWLAGVLLAGKSRLDAERVSARVNGLAPRGNHRHLFDRGDSSGGDRCPARRGRRPDREHRNRSLIGEMT